MLWGAGESSLWSHRTYYGMFRGGKKKKKKSGTREGSRRFKEEQEGEDGEVRG